MNPVSLDFESRSAADLKKVGSDIYARDPSTELLCAAWAFPGEEPQTWLPGEPCPPRLLTHVKAGGTIRAWNARFEYLVWNNVAVARYGWPPLPIEQFQCVMMEALSMGLPGALDNAAAALGLEQRKDAKGGRVMLQLSKPRSIAADGSPVWWQDAEKLRQLIAYNLQDVRTEMAAGERLVRLSAAEQQLWHADQRINDRGVRVDVAAIEAGIALVEDEAKRLNAAMKSVTGGAVATCTATGQLTDWLRWSGVKTDSVDKASLSILLDQNVSPAVRRALELRREAAKSSTAKLKKMQGLTGADGRMRSLFQMNGAATGRWAARGAQLQNLPRPSLVKKEADIDDAIAHFNDPAYLEIRYGSPLQVVSDCVRGMIVPKPGHEFICCDYSNIEGRVLAWLAGEEWKLEAFREFDAGTGHDLYLVSAGRVYRCTPEEAAPHRQIGKVAELALGYGGGVGAFQTMAKNYGVEVEDARADGIKAAWREAHPAVVRFWHALERAAIAAVVEGGTHRARGIAFKKAGSFLWCQLPSKRVLCYPYPEVKDKEMPWSTDEKPAYKAALSYMAVNGITRKWERCDTYGGSLAENVTQAVARDLLAEAMIRVEAAGWNVVMHVHDELVVEALLRACTVETIATLMNASPPWAAGLPVATTGYAAQRYRKD